MRPVRLQASGFGVFRDPIDIDFDDADYFALVGPTGSGKSTVIDAICFALYGRVPRYDDGRVVGAAVTLGASEARVILDFEVAGTRYTALRIVRVRNGKATTREARLERHSPDGTVEQLAVSERDLGRQVEALLGLPFDHFTRCVVLPQGEFDRFLHDKPAQRQDLLVKLLGLEVYKRMGQRAREQAKVAQARAATEGEQLAKLAGATVEAQEAARVRVAGLEALATELDSARPADRALAERISAAQERGGEARAAVALLESVAVPDEVGTLSAAITAAHERQRVAALAAAASREAVAAAERDVEARPEVGELKAAIEAHGLLAEREREVLTLDTALSEAGKARAAATAALGRAAADLAGTVAALEAARAAHMPHALAAQLVVGEACPVCEQVVHALPALDAPHAFEAANAAHTEAQRLHAEAQSIVQVAEREEARAEAMANATRRTRDEVRERIAAHPDIDAVTQLLAEGEAAASALKQAREHDRATATKERDARKEHEQALRNIEQARARYTGQRDPLVALGAPPPASDDLAVCWSELAEWARSESGVREKAAAEAEAEAQAATAERSAALTDLVGKAGTLDIDAGRADLDGLITASTAAVAHAQRDLSDISAAIVEAERLRAAVAGHEQEAEVAAMLGRLLSAREFEEWLVSEALETLAEGASATFERLSGGQYSLALDEGGDFLAVDHANAGETRPVKSLSGGETFQASLALALALADRLSDLAAGASARLEAIFLDEGFGSLDPEALDTVASTIETLAADGRVVGLVTHVRELADRVPVRYEVQKVGNAATVTRTTS
jgi:exonuclease SbcC